MDNNDLMRRLRYALRLDDNDAARLMQLGGLDVELDTIGRWRDKDAGVNCPPEAIDSLLTGFIIDRRGARDGDEPARPARDVDNNRIAKQLRIGLELRSQDIESLVSAGGGKVSRGEIGAIFRHPGHRNFRRCGDQLLRWLLAGLAAERDRP